MPSRLVTSAIVLFWLTTTSVLLYRELAPWLRAGEPPPFTIDLTDEVGSNNTVGWIILQKDAEVGSGVTHVRRQHDRTFILSAEFTLSKFRAFGQEVPRTKITGKYHVTEEGALREGSANVKVDHSLPLEIQFSGAVRERQFHPKLAVLLAGSNINPFALEPFAVSDSGNILNPMHLVHKISGLREGQTWAIPLMDPLRALPAQARELLPGGGDKLVSQVYAGVTTELLNWHGETARCFKISYAKPDDRPLAATWVRRRDDMVLQQWASYEGLEYTLQRVRGQ